MPKSDLKGGESYLRIIIDPELNTFNKHQNGTAHFIYRIILNVLVIVLDELES